MSGATAAVPANTTTKWQDCTQCCGNKWNSYVKWSSENSVRKVEDLTLNADNGVLKRIGKVFAMIVASVLTLPVSLLVASFSYLKEKICGCKSDANPNAPPVDPAAAVAAAAAPVVAPVAASVASDASVVVTPVVTAEAPTA